MARTGIAGRRLIGRSVVVVTMVAAVAGVTVGTAGRADATPVSATFSTPGVIETWTVPAGVTSVHVHAEAGAGGRGRNAGDGGVGGGGGIGGAVDATLAVTPGQSLRIVVGSRGTADRPGAGLANGGRAGYDNRNFVLLKSGEGNGGGATGVTTADGTVLVAAGGGGGGGGGATFGNGGDGGAGGGARGFYGSGDTAGAGGTGSSGANTGGVGTDAGENGGGGGGGGGGWAPTGDGGGAAGSAGKVFPLISGPGGGGAGGRSYAVDPNATFSLGQPAADGKVILSWNEDQRSLLEPTLVSSLNPARIGQKVTFSLQWPPNDVMTLLLLGGGTITFGTFDPKTGVEVPQSIWQEGADIAKVQWTPTQLPVGVTYVWASYSGNGALLPWKTTYLMQVTAEPFRTELTVTPSSLDFGSRPVGSVTTQPVTVLNTGNTPWKLGSITLTDPAFRVTGGTCGAATMAPDDLCTYDIAFAPTAAGPAAGSLVLTEAGGSVTTISFAGSATQLTPPPPQPPTTPPTTTTTAPPTTTTSTTRPPTTTTTPPTTTTTKPTTTSTSTTTTTRPPAGKPTITAVSPASGPRAGGTTVTITGTNLTGVTRIRFGERDATNVSCTSPTRCTATSPRGEETVHIRVTTAAGTSTTSSVDRFRYTGH